MNGDNKLTESEAESDYDFTWVLPVLRNPSKVWSVASSITVTFVGVFFKLFVNLFQHVKVHNRDHITKVLDERPKHVPLLTVSNHYSCLDEPTVWGTLKLRHLLRPSKMRWSVAAHNICFFKGLISYFFTAGKCIPVVRGQGVFQPGIDICIDKLNKGEWVHIFPEGRVNCLRELLRLKWGVGRMVYEAEVTPLVLPIWHIGMDDLMPNFPPYFPRLGKKITFNYGPPIDLTEVVRRLKARDATDVEARKEITDIIQKAMYELRDETEAKEGGGGRPKKQKLALP